MCSRYSHKAKNVDFFNIIIIIFLSIISMSLTGLRSTGQRGRFHVWERHGETRGRPGLTAPHGTGAGGGDISATSKAHRDIHGGPCVKDQINPLSMGLFLMASLWYTVDTLLLDSSIF